MTPKMTAATSQQCAPPPVALANHYPTTTEEAREHISMLLQSSRRMGNHIHEIPTFETRELLLGHWLGKGGFSNVEELRGFVHIPEALKKKKKRRTSCMELLDATEETSSVMCSSRDNSSCPAPEELGYESHEKDDSENSNQLEEEPEEVCSSFSPSAAAAVSQRSLDDMTKCRKFLMTNCLRDSGESRYAIKRLSREIVQNPQQYPSGAMDLAVEALFLADLAHPNIIKLRGIAATDPFTSTDDDYYFLVLDRLEDTLTDRMKKWKERKRRLHTLVGRLSDVGGRKKQELVDERLAAAFDLSAAMSYLKQQRICHRDIKPDNLGFDIRGDIKIFGFGLARELRDLDKHPDMPGMYHLSSMTGSMRYTAPEVAAVGTPYNEACDVYSFTIVLWEMLSLQRAYMTVGRSQESFVQKVHVERQRPAIRHSWSRNLQALLEQGWAHDPTQRLTAGQCNEILRNELVTMRHGDDEGLDHVRRRSTYVMGDGSSREFNDNNIAKRRRSRSIAPGLFQKSVSVSTLAEPDNDEKHSIFVGKAGKVFARRCVSSGR